MEAPFTDPSQSARTPDGVQEPPLPEKDYAALVRALCRPDGESEWVEFKRNFGNPKDVGKYIAALANSAALNEQPYGYLFWGVEDGSGALVGTSFDPHSAKKSNEPLENWLLRLLEPKINFSFHTVEVDGMKIVLAEIERARNIPVRFDGMDYIRVGSVTRPLRQAPERERALWRVFDQTPFEKRLINGGVNTNDAINALDWQKYFKLLGMPTALEPQMAADALCADGMLERNLPDNWNITNLGAILLAEDLRDFSGLWQKAVRVVQYAGKSNIEANRERVFHRGYAVGFEQLMDYIDALLPTKEVIGRIFRETVSMYSIPAVRELVANMLVHQDLAMTGCGPMVEIYSNRVEITNPGESLVKLNRLVDVRPQTRNKAMAAIMRRAGICEELGSGIRNAILAIESAQLPPPRFETLPDFMRVTIYARQDFKDMSRTDRLRAVYQHACLRYVLGEKTSNVSLRQRFGISSRSTTTVSRLLNEALKAEMIVAEKPDASTRSRNYLPNWAAPPPAQASDH